MNVRSLARGFVTQTCGVGWLGFFRNDDDFIVGAHHYPLVKEVKHNGGAGWVIVGFTDERPAYKEAYDVLMERYGQPVFQSPVRRNTRSNRKFFFCIWDTKGKK